MNSVSASAPGKLMLLGEHAVVYGYPCLATAVDARLHLTATEIRERIFELESPDVHIQSYRKSMDDVGKGDIPQGAKFVEIALLQFLKKQSLPGGVRIEVVQGTTPKYGLGSSSAVTVCVLAALSELIHTKYAQREIFDMSFKTVLEIQGKASGFDVAAAVYGGTFYFTYGGKIFEPLTGEDPVIVIGYSGEKASTVNLIAEVAQKRKNYPEKVERIFKGIASLVDEARDRILNRDWERVGRLMDFNQDYLRNLGVSTPKLEAIISAAKRAGGLGAKLSGAGGGDCMISICPTPEARSAVERAIEEAGGTVVRVTLSAHGVIRDTTDLQGELFIVVDENDQVLGYRTRYDCHHDKSLIHRSVGTLIFDSRGRVLLQKRSLTKDTDPGRWGLSSAGHITKGQTDSEAAVREIEEELGVTIPVTFMKKFITREPLETEMAYLFKSRFDGPFRPDPAEVDRVEFFDIRLLKNKIHSGEIQLSGGTRQSLVEAGIL